MNVSLQTVAAETGFARSTVGHVLAGRGDELGLTPRTQQAVLAAARRLGYRPSFFASSLRKGQSDLIVVLGASSASHWRAERQKLTTQLLFDADYRVQRFEWRWARQQSQRFFDLLADLRPRGMIVSEAHAKQTPMLEQFREIGTVMVSGDGPRGGLPELEIDSVYLDRQEVGRMAMHHLLELGHRRIACVQWRKPRAWELRDRVMGYRRALKEAKLPREVLQSIWLRHAGRIDEFAEGYRSMLEVSKQEPRPTGVLATNDSVAIGMLKACHDHGIRVPEDVSIIGAEDHVVGSYLPRPLTTLRFPVESMARAAIALLQQRLEGSTEPMQYQPMQPELVQRATTAPPGECAAWEGGDQVVSAHGLEPSARY